MKFIIIMLSLLQPSVNSEEYKPVVKKSVTYIVAAVLFNERGEVLMMQVGKKKIIHAKLGV